MSKSAKLLYIEDDELERRAFLRLIHARGLPWEVAPAATLAEARAHLAAAHFDVIVTDYHLADGNAIELFDLAQDIPFVLVTGTLEEQLALRTLERGADDYLVKDVEGRHLDALPFAVEKALYRKAIHEKERQLACELQESEQRYRLLVESIPDHAVILLDTLGSIRAWNRGAQHVFGWTKEQIIGQSVEVLFTAEDRTAGEPGRELAHARQEGHVAAARWCVRKDGTRFYATGSIAPMRDAAGEIHSYVKVAADATRQKLAERVLETSERLLRGPPGPGKRKEPIELVPAQRSRLSRYGAAVGSSIAALGLLQVMEPLYNYSAPPLVLVILAVAAAAWWGGLGSGLVATALCTLVAWWAFVPPRHSFAIANTAEGSRLVLMFFSSVAVSAMAEALHRASGRQRLNLARLAVEMQERRNMEEQLREQAVLLDLAHDAIIVWDTAGKVTFWNQGSQQTYGWTAEEAMGRVIHDLLQTRFPKPLGELRVEVVERGGWEGELIHRRKDGQEMVVASRWAVQRDKEGHQKGVLEINRDITQRKADEAALRESEHRYRTLFESMDEGFALCEMIFDAAGSAADFRFLRVNPTFARLTGLAVEQVVGQRVREVIPKLEARWFQVYERVVRTGECARFVDSAAALGRYYEVYAYRPAAGQFAVVFSDVTTRIKAEAELAAAKATAEAANRAKDQFLAVLSHELRNPLTPVLAASAMLRENPGMDADTRDALEMIHRNAELEARLIDDLLDLTRIARGKVELRRHPVTLESILKHAVEVCRPDIEARKLHFGVDMPEGSYMLEADAARLQQVFWNLLKNSIKFTPVGGCVGIRVRRDEGGFVGIDVNDAGVGIEPEALQRIFNPFEQEERGVTRQFGGLGLGLAISKAMVEMHGGTIAAHSEGKGKGATFRVRLPLITAPTAPATEVAAGPPAAGAPVGPRRALRILLVEDHGDTARIMSRLLRAQGHAVEHAADVATALRLIQEQSFDLLVSDLGLPDGTGLDIMRNVRQRGLDWPAIALSGYGQEQDVQRSRDAGFAAHVTKPVDFPTITGVIRRVTEGTIPQRGTEGQRNAEPDPRRRSDIPMADNIR